MKSRLIPILLPLACTPPPQTQTHEQPLEQAPPAAVQTPDPEPAEPEAAPPKAPEDAPKPGLAFHPAVYWRNFIASGEAQLRVFATRDGDVFLTAGPQVMKAEPDGTVERDPTWLGGIKDAPEADHEGTVYLPAWYVETLGGRWPDALFMTINPLAGGRSAYPMEVYRFANGRWTFLPSVQRKVVRSHPRAIAHWKDDSIVSLRGFTPVAEPEDEFGLSRADERAFKAALSKLNPLAVVRGTPKAPNLGDVTAFDALPSGELVAITTGRRVVHLSADGSRTTRPLPDADDLSDANVTMSAGEDIHVFGAVSGDGSDEHDRPYLAHFDGSTWQTQAVPPCAGAAVSFASFPGGEAWLLCSPTDPWFGGDLENLQGSGTVWYLQADTWSQVPLPKGARGMQLVATAPDEVWVASDRGIFYTKKPPSPLELPPRAELTLQLREQAEPVPLLSCDWGTTLLRRDPGGEHPKTVEALEAIGTRFGTETGDLRLVEVDFRGTPHLALQTTFSGIPKEVATEVEEALGDALGETRCVLREPRRVLWSISPQQSASAAAQVVLPR